MIINCNSFWIKFEEFNSYYRIHENTLKIAPILHDGTVGTDNQAIVSSISDEYKSLDFLHKINSEFGTDLRYEMFIK